MKDYCRNSKSKGNWFNQAGLAQIPLMVGLLLMAIALPAATKLVQQNQNTQNRAATCTPGAKRTFGECCGCGKAKEVTATCNSSGTGETFTSGSCSHDSAGCTNGCAAPTSGPQPTSKPQPTATPQCQSWEVWQNGSCKVKAGGGCTSNEMCADGKLCSGGVCGGGTGPTCTGCSPINDDNKRCNGTTQEHCGNDGCWHHDDAKDNNALCAPPTNTPVPTRPAATSTPKATPTPDCTSVCIGLEGLEYTGCISQCMNAGPTQNWKCTPNKITCANGVLSTCKFDASGWTTTNCPSNSCASTTSCATCTGVCSASAPSLPEIIEDKTATCAVGLKCWVTHYPQPCGTKPNNTTECANTHDGFNQCQDGKWVFHSCGSGLVCPAYGSVCVAPTPTPVPPTATPTNAISPGSGCLQTQTYQTKCVSGNSYQCMQIGALFQWTLKTSCGNLGCNSSNGLCVTPTPTTAACLGSGIGCVNGGSGATGCGNCCQPASMIDNQYRCGVVATTPTTAACLGSGIGCVNGGSGATSCANCCQPASMIDNQYRCGVATPTVDPNCMADGTRCYGTGGSPNCNNCCNGSYNTRVDGETVERSYCGSMPDVPVEGNCASMWYGSYIACSNQPIGAQGPCAQGNSCQVFEIENGYNKCMCKPVLAEPTPTPTQGVVPTPTGQVCPCTVGTEMSCSIGVAGQTGYKVCQTLGIASKPSCGDWSECVSNKYACNKLTGNCEANNSSGTYTDKAYCDGQCDQDVSKKYYECDDATWTCKETGTGRYTDVNQCSNNCKKPGTTVTPTTGMPRGCSDSSSRCIYGDGTGAVSCGNGFKNTGSCTTYASQGSFLVDGICCAPDQPTAKACSEGTCTLSTVCPARKMENTPRESCATYGTGIVLQSGICCIDNPNLVTPTPTNTIVPTNRPSTVPTTIPTSIPTTIPTQNPTSPPGGGPTNPPGNNCSYSSLQSRVQANDSDPWKTSMTVVNGETVNIGCMYNTSGQLASSVKLIATYSDGTKEEFNTNKKTDWVPIKTGVVTIKCQSTASNCNNLTSDAASLTVTAAACYDCPSVFRCYKNGENYKWFVLGYEQTGYVHDYTEDGVQKVVPDSACTTRQVVKPTFKGKAKADADCNGVTDQADYSIWRKEYLDKIKTGSRWESDFDCNNLVDQADYSNWRRFYLDFK